MDLAQDLHVPLGAAAKTPAHERPCSILQPKGDVMAAHHSLPTPFFSLPSSNIDATPPCTDTKYPWGPKPTGQVIN
ncbi:hypothetical protein J1614_009165 [Plenodomus biglobosus]|nr:hypothetical protein J1614_009165 [Plenodomus biglobosus]